MYINYNQFINENKIEGITPEEIDLLKKYDIKDYKFNPETNLIDIFEHVYLSFKQLNSLPKIRFGVIHGSFGCSNNQLTSLEYCPLKVNGNFNCYQNKLTSLEFCPKEIDGAFVCYNNKLTSLKYLSKKGISYLSCNENLLTSLEGCPEIIKSDFTCGNNRLTSLEFCPKEINGGFYCQHNQLTSLEHCPKIVNGDFDCSNNKLKSIEDYPLCKIKGTINDFRKFKEILKIVKKNKDVFENLLDDKVRFHQTIMRYNLDLIPMYKTIQFPKKYNILI